MDWNQYKEVGGGLEVDLTWPAKDTELRVNDFIEGRYVEKVEGVGKNKANVYILEVDGKRIGVWGGTVLDNKFAKISVGKMVAIQYLGFEKSEKGTKYKNFKVGFGINTVGDEGQGPTKFSKVDDKGLEEANAELAGEEIGF